MKQKSVDDQQNKKGKIINCRYLFYGFLALLFGITISRHLFDGQVLYIVVTVVALLIVTLSLLFFKRFAMMIVLVVMFFGGCGLFYAGQAAFVGKKFDGECAVVGRVSDQMSEYDSGWSITLDNISINGKSEKNMILYVYDAGKALEFSAGDMVAFQARVDNARLFEMGVFNSFYYRKNAPYTASVDENEVVVSHGAGGVRYDEVIRAKTKSLLEENMSQRNAAICYAVLFGDKSGVDDVTYYNFNQIGLLHILTVSGLHVGFLVSLLYFLLKKCNKFVRASIIFAVLLLYNILCGFAPSVMRASIMAIVMVLAKLSGREYDGLSALSLAGFIIVLFRPLSALDVGFLMSYFCVAGIILLQKPLFKFFNKFLPRFAANYFSVTLAAQIGILPFAATIFASFNIVAPFANMIIIPIFGMIFPVLFVLFILGLVLPFMGIFLHVVDWGVEVINFIARIFASGGLMIDLKPYPIVFGILFCLFLFVASGLVMRQGVAKLFICSWLVLGLSAGVIICDNVSREKNILFYLDAAQPIVYAVNDEGQSLLVCQNLDADEFATFAHLLTIKKIDFILTLEQNVEQSLVDDYGTTAVGYPNLLEINKKSYAIEGEQVCQLGEFTFNYVYGGESLAGVKFAINNFEIFFATNNYLSYNIKEQVSQKVSACQLCFLNGAYGISTDGATFSRRNGEGSDYSLNSFGNMKLKLNKNSWSVRCID